MSDMEERKEFSSLDASYAATDLLKHAQIYHLCYIHVFLIEEALKLVAALEAEDKYTLTCTRCQGEVDFTAHASYAFMAMEPPEEDKTRLLVGHPGIAFYITIPPYQGATSRVVANYQFHFMSPATGMLI